MYRPYQKFRYSTDLGKCDSMPHLAACSTEPKHRYVHADMFIKKQKKYETNLDYNPVFNLTEHTSIHHAEMMQHIKRKEN